MTTPIVIKSCFSCNANGKIPREHSEIHVQQYYLFLLLEHYELPWDRRSKNNSWDLLQQVMLLLLKNKETLGTLNLIRDGRE